MAAALLSIMLAGAEAHQAEKQILLGNSSITLQAFVAEDAFKHTHMFARLLVAFNPALGLRANLPANLQLAPRQSPRLWHDIVLEAPGDFVDASRERPSRTKVWPCWDALDKQICQQAVPTIINFLSLPLTGAIDNAFIGALANPLASAGQLAADQVYAISGLFTEVLPTATRPLIAKAYAAENKNDVTLTVGAAIFLSVILGSFVTLIVGLGSGCWLLAIGNQAVLSFSLPYLLYRLPGVIPSTVSSVGFSSLQSVMDSITPIKVSFVSLVLNAVLNYLLMFPAGLGIAGAALATAVSQIVAGLIYFVLLLRRNLVRWSTMLRPPSREMLLKFAPSVGALQVQSIARQVAFTAITKVTQGIDNTGVAAAAHALTLNFWQLGGVVLYAMQFAASTLTSAELGKKDSTPEAARAVAQRLLAWGALTGCMMAAMQLLGLPFLQFFHRSPEVREAARMPSVIGAALQVFNGFLFVGEGVMLATGAVGMLAIGRVAASAGMLLALRLAPSTLVGAWNCFWAYIFIRLVSFIWFFWFAESPLLPGGRLPAWAKRKSS